MKARLVKTDYSCGNHWRIGNYKIVGYEYFQNGSVLKKLINYQAYEPDHFYKGKPVFGNRIDRTISYYKTLGDAVEACKKHKTYLTPD